MSTRRVGNSVSLFPFLAVLVCAMGALIFLLLVVTRQIRAEARATAIQQADAESVLRPPAAPEPLAPQPSDIPAIEPVVEPAVEPEPLVLDDVDAVEINWSRMLDSLTTRHRDGARELGRARSEVESAEIRLKEVNGELALLQQDETESRGRRAELDAKLTRLRVQAREFKQQAQRQQQEIRERRVQIESAESQFAFLPFDSATGTRRRPIFIECHPDRIEFASEKIDLTAANLAGFTRRANPLLAGVRALVDHWSKRDAESGAAENIDPASRKPYVLMVVRPGGIHAYYLARKLLSRLETPIGYELVPASMPLAWPSRDRVAADACRAAIELSVARRPRSGGTVAGNAFRGGFSGGRLPRLGQPQTAGTGRLGSGKSQRMTRPARKSATGKSGGGGLATRVILGDETGRASSGRRADGLRSPNGTTADGVKGGVMGEGGSGETGAGETRTASRGGGGGTGQSGEAPTFESLTVGPRLSGGSSAGRSRQPGGGPPRRWGVASLGATIGYERRVRVRIDPTRITVAEQPRIDIATAGGGELSAAEIRQKVIRAVQLTARSWGAPPERFYWVPAIQFEVTPGGFLFYERLNGVFRNWRLSTSVEFILPPPPPSEPPIRLMQGLFQEPLP